MATLKDVAQKANLSPAAVSRILNNDPSLSVPPETRQRVKEAARLLGYRKKRKSGEKSPYTMGILQWFSPSQELEDTYYLSIRHGIEKFCLDNRLSVIRAFKNDVNCTDSLSQANGLICIGKFTRQEVEAFQKLCDPLLLIDMESPLGEIPSVTLDFSQAVTEAMEYLTGLGHREIGFLGGAEHLEDGSQFSDPRKHFFTEYCRTHGITYLPYLKEGRFSSGSGYEMALELIREGNLPSAVFAASDPIALGAMKAFEENGIRVPEDLSVLGFDDIRLCEMASPPLTTIHAPAYEMGWYGAGILYHLQTGPAACPIQVRFPSSLIVRGSCQKK